MQQMTLTPPAVVDDKMDACSANVAAMVATHAAGKAALAGLGYGGTVSGSESASPYTSPYTSPTDMLVIAPTDEGICTRRGDYGYMTSAKLLEAVSAHFADMHDEDSRYALLVLIGGVDETSLASALATFNAAWPITELERVQRRMGNLATLERDKMVITEAGAYPYARHAAPARHVIGLYSAHFVGVWSAIADGMDNLSPISTTLSDFATRHSAKKAEAQVRVEALQEAITGDDDGFFVHATTGTPTALAHNFAALPPPLDEAFKCCVGVCFYGNEDNMTYLRQLFGVLS